MPKGVQENQRLLTTVRLIRQQESFQPLQGAGSWETGSSRHLREKPISHAICGYVRSAKLVTANLPVQA